MSRRIRIPSTPYPLSTMHVQVQAHDRDSTRSVHSCTLAAGKVPQPPQWQFADTMAGNLFCRRRANVR